MAVLVSLGLLIDLLAKIEESDATDKLLILVFIDYN